MIIYGKNAVAERVKNGGTFDKLLVLKGSHDKKINELIDEVKKTGAAVFFRDKAALDREANGANHQGLVAFVTDFSYKTIDDVFARAEERNEPPFILIADGIEDPHNLGAIIRVADCVGAHGVVISKNRCAQVTDTVVKVAAGATEYVPVARVGNINETIDNLKKRGVWVYALEVGGESCFTADLTGAAAIVVGSEGFGVHELTKTRCDKIISLPLKGSINSLNASVAVGICAYEKLRQDLAKRAKLN